MLIVEPQNRAALEHLAACLLLTMGGALEVAGIDFPGLDILTGLCFAAAMVFSVRALIHGSPLFWCTLPLSLAAAALGLHLYLNFGG